MNTEEERASLGRTVYTTARLAQPERTRLRKEDFLGAVASCWPVVLSLHRENLRRKSPTIFQHHLRGGDYDRQRSMWQAGESYQAFRRK